MADRLFCSLAAEERKLFIGMLPRSYTESDVAAIFAPFGTVEDCTVLRDGEGQSKGSLSIWSSLICRQQFEASY